ncbi:universal stress protein [Flavobacteriaceae bacterium F89]|uniref:Universal stress protein n=1 Tax=Cerina litoralis TaxID=2874477 RepID=A0AAE3EWT3_9FLAO|nr:universal stress protein [Cerina litoralis]MCG2462323.1 universal stress protein [Cerina litoralis]
MKKVLVPTDFSENAYNAIRYAIQLYAGQKTTFYLLHTYTPPIFQVEYLFYSPSQVGLGDPYQVRAIKQLRELQERLLHEFDNPEHTFVTRAVFNTLTDEILSMTLNEGIDLVVMGTKGVTGAKEILFGTNTAQVIGKTTCPVIAVPSGFEFEVPKRILFPTDYEINFDEEQLQQLLNISKNYDSNVDIIHVSAGYDLTNDQGQNKQTLKSVLDKVNHEFHDLPDQGVIEAINLFQTKKKMDLLVMVRNKHTFLERLFVEPVIKKIGININIPFMVLPYTDMK